MANNSVKLPTAYFPLEDRFIHVSEKLPPKADLLCPFCEKPVSAKKGNERQHHFYHLTGSDEECSPPKDDLLHEGAKVFLFNSLMRGDPVRIIIPDMENLPPEFAELLNVLSISGCMISSNSLPGYFCPFHGMENQIDKIKPDITSYDHLKNPVFAWEIFVTHPVEENKRLHLTELSYGYIELKPVPIEPSGYTFFLESYGGFDLLKKKDLQNYLFEQTKETLLEHYTAQLSEHFKSKLVAEVNGTVDHRIEAEVNRRIAIYKNSAAIDHKNDIWGKARVEAISAFKKKMDAVDIAGIVAQTISETNLLSKLSKKACLTILSKGTPDSEQFFTEPLDLVEFINFNLLKVNKKYEVASLSKLFAQVVEDIAAPLKLKGIVSEDEKNIIGFEVVVDGSSFEKKNEKILLGNIQKKLKTMPAEGVSTKKSKATNNDYCYLKTWDRSLFIQNYVRLFQMLLSKILEFYRCEVILLKSDSAVAKVVGIKIYNLCLPEKLNREISELINKAIENFRNRT